MFSTRIFLSGENILPVKNRAAVQKSSGNASDIPAKNVSLSLEQQSIRMKVINLGENNTVLSSFIAEMRDRTVQKDSLRFRTAGLQS